MELKRSLSARVEALGFVEERLALVTTKLGMSRWDVFQTQGAIRHIDRISTTENTGVNFSDLMRDFRELSI